MALEKSSVNICSHKCTVMTRSQLIRIFSNIVRTLRVMMDHLSKNFELFAIIDIGVLFFSPQIINSFYDPTNQTCFNDMFLIG